MSENWLRRFVNALKGPDREKRPPRAIHHVLIRNYNSSKKAFDQVIKLFCDELNSIFADGIKDPTIYMSTPQEFVFPIDPRLDALVAGGIDIAKKNVQSKIRSKKEYNGILLTGTYTLEIDLSEIGSVFEIVRNDQYLSGWQYPLFLNIAVLYYTTNVEVGRSARLLQSLEDHLNLPSPKGFQALKDNEMTAFENAVENLSSRMKSSVKEIEGDLNVQELAREALTELGDKGMLVLAQQISRAYNLEDLRNDSSTLQKLSELDVFLKQYTQKSDTAMLREVGLHRGDLDEVSIICNISTVDNIEMTDCFIATVQEGHTIEQTDAMINMEARNRLTGRWI